VVGALDGALEDATARGPMARIRAPFEPLNILIIGATGNVGGRVAIELFRSGEVKRLRLSARDREEAASLAARFSASSPTDVVPQQLDVAEGRLSELLRGEDVVVNCAGPGYELEEHAVRAAIAAGVDYVSLCDDHTGTDAALRHDHAASEAGITVVSGCGLSPGITSYLVGAAAAGLDAIADVQIAVAASSADSDGYASARHLIFSLSQEAPFISDGALSSDKAGTIPRRIYFPEPVGWVETFICGHPEVSTIPRMRADLASVQFRIGLTERVVMDLIRASRASGLLRTEAMRKAWLKATWPTRSVVERIPPRGATWTAARVDVHGTLNGTASIVSLGVVDHLVNLASLSIKEAALALGRGEARAKGVRGPEEAFDPATMLKRLSQRGVRTARLEPELV
jgi:saccharopine dehydrogenase-like NADP-dependent oxidoreductase